jgi:hypothetical protein
MVFIHKLAEPFAYYSAVMQCCPDQLPPHRLDQLDLATLGFHS